jgi:hypothetical protein
MLAGTCCLVAVVAIMAPRSYTGVRGVSGSTRALCRPRAEPARTTLEGLIAVAQALEANTVAGVLSRSKRRNRAKVEPKGRAQLTVV